MSKQPVETAQLGGFPRVDLLPPATRDAIRRRPIVRRLVIAVIGVALIVGVAVAGASVLAFAANALLAAERDRSELLLAQQLEFAEARSIASALDESEAARQVATSAEVDWEALLAEIKATLPAGVQLISVDGTITSSGAVGAGGAEGDATTEPEPLRQDSIGSFRINATSPTVPDVQAWLNDLESVTGFAGIAPPVSVVGSEGASYTVTIEVLLNDEAFLGRYAPEADESAPDESTTEEEGE